MPWTRPTQRYDAVVGMLDSIRHDVVYALRGFRLSRGFTLVARELSLLEITQTGTPARSSDAHNGFSARSCESAVPDIARELIEVCYTRGDAMKAALIVALLGAMSVPAQETSSPDAEGFIRDWLVLAPIAIGSESGADEIDKDLINGEAAVKPKAGGKITVGGAQLTWNAHTAPEYFIDFLAAFGKTRGEYVAGYAVTYILADEEMKVTLALSSNDQGKAWLNGQQVFKFADTRTLEKDSDRSDVTLKKGSNVLVLKVINEVNNWQGCARFLKDGAPVKNLRISLVPQ